MKVTAYVRVGYDREGNGRAAKPRVVASNQPNEAPIYNSRNEPIPTVAFAIDLNLPDALFRRAEKVIAELEIPASSAGVAATVRRRP